MSVTGPISDDSERFAWLERENDDFPYYRSHPVGITTGGWLFVLSGVAIGFVILTQGPKFVSGLPAGFTLAFLYSAIPLVALAWVAGRHWKALFRPLRLVDFFWMIAFALLNLVMTLVMGSIIKALIDTTPNEAMSQVGQMQGGNLLAFFARTGIQLIGEEVMSILPLLAVLFWLTSMGFGRKASIVLATLAVAVLFAAEHLPTYNWNILQTLMGVGVARIVLLLPYIMTKNLAVAAGAHILNDWMFFAISLLATLGPPAA